jgi:large subunit ribosomal protein L7/L12
VKTQIAPPASKSQLNVVLVTAGPSKIKVIREVQALAGLSLTQARGAVEGAPQAIKENLSPTEASLI